ncbi:MAG TPA: hypothetical protein VKB51_16325 [bacterium]|nr:hypothetical protein [bacterium]
MIRTDRKHLPGVRRRTAAAALLIAGLLLAASGAQAAFWFSNRPMPEFTNQSPSAWLNSKPLTREDLRGKVVLIEVFTSS